MNTYVDRKVRKVEAEPQDVFRVVCGLGGETGWYSPRWLWSLRGLLDRMVGGPGLLRRRHPEELVIGDSVDFWTVTAVAPPQELSLMALMKVPGVAVLRFEIAPVDSAPRLVRLTQTASFTPRGPLGRLYWLSLLPIHRYVFNRMIDGIAASAEERRREG